MARAIPTRARILERGVDLMTGVGILGVTLGMLAKELGMSKSGLFAHFQSKEALQLGLLEHMATVAEDRVVKPAMEAPEGLARLRALAENWFGWTGKAGLRGGCPVAAAMFELDDVEGEVREKVLRMESYWRGLLIELVQQAMDRRDLRRDLDAEQFVWELCGIYLSHHASSRFLRDARADRRAREAFEALIARWRAVPEEMPITEKIVCM